MTWTQPFQEEHRKMGQPTPPGRANTTIRFDDLFFYEPKELVVAILVA